MATINLTSDETYLTIMGLNRILSNSGEFTDAEIEIVSSLRDRLMNDEHSDLTNEAPLASPIPGSEWTATASKTSTTVTLGGAGADWQSALAVPAIVPKPVTALEFNSEEDHW